MVAVQTNRFYSIKNECNSKFDSLFHSSLRIKNNKGAKANAYCSPTSNNSCQNEHPNPMADKKVNDATRHPNAPCGEEWQTDDKRQRLRVNPVVIYQVTVFRHPARFEFGANIIILPTEHQWVLHVYGRVCQFRTHWMVPPKTAAKKKQQKSKLVIHLQIFYTWSNRAKGHENEKQARRSEAHLLSKPTGWFENEK